MAMAVEMSQHVYVLSIGWRDYEQNIGVYTDRDTAEQAAQQTKFWDPKIPPQPLAESESAWLGGRGGDTILIERFELTISANRR